MAFTRILFLVGMLTAASTSTPTTPWLSDWMAHTVDIIGNQTLLDLSLPGTHDTLTYDLSSIISDGGLDGKDALSAVLNALGGLDIGEDLWGSFARTLAVSQGLSITAQLDAGIRFVDARIMYEYSTSHMWYSLHAVQSNQIAKTYLTQIRQWLDVHPSEVVVIALSKHGGFQDLGTEQYPATTIAQKQAFWSQILEIFNGLLFDSKISSVNRTQLSELIARNHRVIIWATGAAPNTLDTQ